eukprot:3475184-Karenia_brevis.AAC.1
MVNQCKTLHSRMKVKQEDGTTDMTAEELEQGAISICRALDGVYADPVDPRIKKKVNGDFTK